MLISIAAVIAGLALLVWSADRFVEGASVVALNLGVSTLIIGITIIGFGTSAPEILISLFSVFDGTPDLAIGNALGSNIANIGLILGATALFTPVIFTSKLIRREFPILLIASGLLVWALWDAKLEFIEGLALLTALVAAMGYLIHFSKTDRNDPMSDELDDEIPHDVPTSKALVWTLIGLLVLVGSSKLLVWGAVNIATFLGVSELIIGLTIVALGTSLPELAAAIVAARKGELEMIMGNVIGSNLFNTLAVIGLPSIMVNFSVSSDAVSRDLPIMLALTMIMFIFAQFPRNSYCKITRLKGILLLGSFVVYQCLLYFHTISY